MNRALFKISSPKKTVEVAENLAELTFVERMQSQKSPPTSFSKEHGFGVVSTSKMGAVTGKIKADNVGRIDLM